MNSSEFEVHQSHNSLVDESSNPRSYVQEIRTIPLAVERHKVWGHEIASAQRALDALSRITTLISLDSEQREQINLLLSDNTCKFLLDQYRLELASRQKRQRKGGNIDDADLRFLKLYKKQETKIKLLLTGISNKDLGNFPAKFEEYVDGELETVDQGLKAYENLVVHNLRLIVDRALPFEGFGVDLNDLVGFGSEGLMIAAARWDFQKGFEFSTFATWWIHQRVGRAVQDFARTVRIPSRLMKKFYKMQREQDKLGKPLDLVKNSDYRLVENTRHVVSLNLPVGEDQEGELGDFIPDKTVDLDIEPEREELKIEVAEALATLPARERLELELRFGIIDGYGRTLVEVAKEMPGDDVTRERVRQIEAKALKKLRHPSIANKLRDFLDQDPKAEKVSVGNIVKAKRRKRKMV